ncbi:MAG: DNA cytosine methyltransferase, partial [Chitinophagaceae bacterium]
MGVSTEWIIIPQKRHRVILLGIRNDIELMPTQLTKAQSISLRSVIGDLPKVRSGLHREFIGSEKTDKNGILKKKRNYKLVKDSFEAWKKLIESYAGDLRILLPQNLQHIEFPQSTIGSEFSNIKSSVSIDHPLYKWYNDDKINGIINHVSRSHLVQDLKRYLFSSLYANKFSKFPRMDDYKVYG